MPNLSKILGVKLEKHDTEIRKFAEKHSQYVRLKDMGHAIFSTEDTVFEIQADINSKGQRCYWGTIKVYCPTKIIFHTKYKNSVEEVISSFSTFLKRALT